MGVMMQVAMVGRERGWVSCSLDERAEALLVRADTMGALCGRAVIRERAEGRCPVLEGALGALHWKGALCERAAVGALRERAGETAAALHGRAGALGALSGRAALHERPGVGSLCERAGALHERAGALHERAGALSGRADALGWCNKIHKRCHVLSTGLVIPLDFSIHVGGLA